MKNKFGLFVTLAILAGGSVFSGLSLLESRVIFVAQDPDAAFYFWFLLILIGLSSGMFAFIAGTEIETGSLASESNLKINHIYERIIAGPADGGGYVIVLRLQDGKIAAFKLKRNVPEIFKVVAQPGNPGEYDYQPYPKPEEVSA